VIYIAPRITQGQLESETVYTVAGQKYGSYVLNGDYPIYQLKISTKKNIWWRVISINQEDIDQARKSNCNWRAGWTELL